jgi:hypothetical protein
MPAATPVVILAVTAWFVVAAALCRQVLVLRAGRRELDLYLRWLLEQTVGPVSLVRSQPWR